MQNRWAHSSITKLINFQDLLISKNPNYNLEENLSERGEVEGTVSG